MALEGGTASVQATVGVSVMPAVAGLNPAVDPLAREMAVMKKLDHPNVVKLLEVRPLLQRTR